ncbi:MAG: GTPase ObgE [Anaerolineales bacterium]|nr:GTPase ObgE [Anaerolineales bacterium]
MFIDQAIITVSSGKGGDGMVHFHREKYVSRGGPDGGDGGKGGDVILEVTRHVNTLFPFRNQRIYRADNGKNGGINKMSGRYGENLIIKVPAGTLVYDEETGDLIGDLTEEGQTLTIASGGRGGRGNTHFATPTNKVPHMGEKGEPAEERILRLELKLIADVGLVGVPNAGKSTLLSVATNATPKIANYPFTTLEPNLGVAQLDEENSLVLADIPGLIEGAHMGIGLGHDFLRHIQRTRVIIHILDGLAQDPIADFAQINSELALFDPELAEKPQVVAVNKMDLPEVNDLWPLLDEELRKHGVNAIPISAVAQTNVRELLYRAAQILAELPPVETHDEIPLYQAESDPNDFIIQRTPDGSYRVQGVSIERAAAMTYWEYDQSVRRFQRILEFIGIDKALREAGIEEGDSVLIGDYVLEWED